MLSQHDLVEKPESSAGVSLRPAVAAAPAPSAIIINSGVVIKLNAELGRRAAPVDAGLILISPNVTAEGVLGCRRQSRASGSRGGVIRGASAS